jgi:hypothetical protein
METVGVAPPHIAKSTNTMAKRSSSAITMAATRNDGFMPSPS